MLKKQVASMEMSMLSLQEQFGEIDIYVFDQLLKGRIAPCLLYTSL